MCNCNKKCCNSKKNVIPHRNYHETLDDFNSSKGILYPIYANIIIDSNIVKDSYTLDSSIFINKMINIFNGHESCSNKVVGYFASLPSKSDKRGYTISMSFCAPIDYNLFNYRYARFFAMRKALSENCLLAHCDKKQQIIYSKGFPLYYFSYGNTIMDQFNYFRSKCDKYYHQ